MTTIHSIKQFKETYFPKQYEKEYLQEMAKGGEINKLAKYLVDNNLDAFDMKLNEVMSSENLGKLIAQEDLIKISKSLVL